MENSLDAAEDAGSLPEIDITMCACARLMASIVSRMLRASACLYVMLTNKVHCSEEISQKRLNSIRGISNHDRLDEELYLDHETDEAKKVTEDHFSVPYIAEWGAGLSCNHVCAEAPGKRGQGAREA